MIHSLGPRLATAALASSLLIIVSVGVRGAGQPVYAPGGEPVAGKNWLVLIAINEYRHHQNLSAPRRDAEAMRDVLWQRYAFEPQHTLTLFDEQATRRGILGLFRSLADKINDDDSLLVYYAGHGELDDFTQLGYWIPHDAGGREEKLRWIPNVEIRESLAALRARHTLLIADACFAGKLLTQSRELRPTIDDAYFKRAYQKLSREVLTSGEEEAVEDVGVRGHSTFAWHLIETLRRNRRPYLDPLAIYDQIRQPVGKVGQLALLGSLKQAGHSEGGSFLFFLRPSAETVDRAPAGSTAPVAGPSSGPVVSESLRRLAEQKKDYEYVAEYLDTVEGWQAFLEQYPSGKFSEKARRRLSELRQAIRPGDEIPSSLQPGEPVGQPPEMEQPGREQPTSGAAGSLLSAEFALPSGMRRTAQGIVRDKDGMVMVYIPPGSFLMGGNEGMPAELPVHRVNISRGFFVDRHEVTETQYSNLLGNKRVVSDYPVMVNPWEKADQYCRLVGGRLLTEAEWEYVARGGLEGKAYPWGDEDVCEGESCRANFCDAGCSWKKGRDGTRNDGFKDRAPVCQYGEFGYGLCDMAGNMAEWVSDFYLPGVTKRHVVRGGSYSHTRVDLRVSRRRQGGTWGTIDLFAGIRCAFDP